MNFDLLKRPITQNPASSLLIMFSTKINQKHLKSSLLIEFVVIHEDKELDGHINVAHALQIIR